MRGVLTKEFAEGTILPPIKKRFDIALVGSLAEPEHEGGGRSYNDIDIVHYYTAEETTMELYEFLQESGWRCINKAFYKDNLKAARFAKAFGSYDVDLEVYCQQKNL